MRSKVSNSPGGLKLTRRSFVTVAGVVAANPSLVAWAEGVVPPKFVRSSNLYILRREEEELWVIDRRWFDVSGGGISIEAGGNRLRISGLLGGSNIALNLSISIKADRLAFSSFGGPEQLVSLDDLRRYGVEIMLRAEPGTGLPVRVTGPSKISAKLVYPFNIAAAPKLSFSGADVGSGTATGFSTSVSTKWDEVEPEIDQLVPGARPLTRYTLEGVTVEDSDGWNFGSFGGRVLRLFFGNGAGRITLERIATGTSQKRILRRHGTAKGASGARLRYGEQQWGRDIYLSAIEALQVLGGTSKQQSLKIARSADAVYIEAEKFAAAFKVARDCYFPGYREQSQIVLPIELLVFHARGDDDTRFDVDFRTVAINRSGLGVGEPGLNRSALVWNAEGTTGVPAALSLGIRKSVPSDTWLHLGQHDAAQIVLHRPGAIGIETGSPWLRLRRSLDGLNLGLLFYNFRIEIGENAKLVALDGAQRGVRFNPQHIEEECFSIPSPQPVKWFPALWWLRLSTALTSPHLRQLGSSQNATWFPGAPTTLIARTRVSGDSRIIFAPERAREFPLTAEDLTNWADLDMAVSDRAIGEVPIEDQLAVVNITQTTSRAEAKTNIASKLKQPRPAETSLELVTGLFFSPERTARFRTTSPAESPPALWTAQLDLNPPANRQQPGAANSVVRAIWASGLDPSFLFEKDGGYLDPDPFSASTTQLERIEIALQSSVFGLAALRSVTKQGVDVPNSRVRRVSDKWHFVDHTTEPSPDDPKLLVVQEGAFSPAPFKAFTARLTGFGADLDAEWQAEPIVPYRRAPKGQFFEKAFNVERYVHRTRLGSDSLAQVVKKGFLFPYGFRVSLVKITQREPGVLAEFGAMMPLVTRYFIVPKPITKTFPGIYQPFSARGIPLRSARLLADRTPELDPYALLPPEGLVLPPIKENPDNKERVFWPVMKNGGRLQFDFIADDLETRRTLPMLFVSNLDATLPASVRAIIDFYNQLGEEDRREDHYHGKTIYALPRPAGQDSGNEAGSTSFETDHIILQARPRALTDGADADAPYTVDAFMNGVDEPPFYPMMEQALVSIPPLDRIMGSPQGLNRVGYNSTYLQNGFDQSENRAELYLDFLDVKTMSLGGDGRVSGGLAQPQNYIAAISRINSVVGAPRKDEKPQHRLFEDKNFPSGIESPWNFETIQKQFNPKDYFKNAKLFGHIDLSDVIEAAAIELQPRMKQAFEYDLSGGIEILETACSSAGGLIGIALEEADKKLKAVFGSTVSDGLPIDPSEVSLERFYPDLTLQLNAFKDLLERDVDDEINPIVWVNRLMAQWGPVKASIDAVIANPSPEPLRAGMAELRALIDGLQTAFGEGLRQAIASASDNLVNGAIDAFIEEIVSSSFDANGDLQAPWFYEAITGTAPAADVDPDGLRNGLHALFDDPAAGGAKVGDAILAKAVTGPALSLLAQAKVIEETVAEQGGAAIATAVRAAAPLLQRAAELVVEFDVLIEAAQKNAGELCIAAGSALRLEDLCRLLIAFAPSDSELDFAIETIRQAWPDLDLPDLPESPAIKEARQASHALRRTVTDLQAALHSFAGVRRDIARLKLDELCRTQPQYLVTLGARLVSVRNLVFPAMQSSVRAAADLADIYARLPQTGLDEALAELKLLRHGLLVLAADVTFTRLNDLEQRIAWLDTVPVVGERVKNIKAQVLSATDDLRKKVANATEQQLESIVAAATNLSAVERRLFELAADFVALTNTMLTTVERTRRDVLALVAQPVIVLHAGVLDQANKAIAVFDGAPDLVKLFTRKVYARLVLARDILARDNDALAKLAMGSSSTEVKELLERWSHGDFGLVAAVDLVLEFFTAIMTGQIGGVFDLVGVRRAVESALQQLLPTRVNTSFDFGARLKKWQIFEPLPDDQTITLTTHISVDLLKPSDRKVDVTGRITPFRLNLIESPDLVSISFAETSFTFDGFVPKFKTQVNGVTPGKDLSFFNNIAQVLDLDANIYAEPTGDPAGIRVGYGYSKDLIDLGGVQILNFGFDASLALYLDGSPAVARIQIAEREAPCGLIVAPFYYGAAYIALTTTPKQIRAFEIQLEFGVARALKFGPLSGFAAVSAGIYLMSAQTGTGHITRLEGFVHAVGEGSIACFGVSVNFEVKVIHDSGNVKGAATYRFSFRIGLVKVGYGVTANYTFSGHSNIASLKDALSVEGAPGTCGVLPDKTKEWLCYRDHFVTDWPET